MSENQYGTPQNQSQDSNILPGQNDPARGQAAFSAALEAAQQHTGEVPGENTQGDPRDDHGQLPTLDLLMREAEKEITNFQEMHLPDEYRPGWSIIVDCVIPGPELDRYVQQARKKGSKDDINSTELNCRILINKVTELRYQGETQYDDKGHKLNFRSQLFLKSMGKSTAIDALRRFLWDSHIAGIAAEVMTAAGYSTDSGSWVDAKPVNPTRG